MRALATAAFALLIAASAASAATYTLNQTGTGWPACDPGVVQRSGYLDINDAEDKHYFYWMFEAKQNASTAPVILWMTGGPGCSSSLAILAENGPCHINENTGELYSNPYSWNNVANIIYIDQPAGVGFSYANSNGYDYNETMVAEDMYQFFQQFYTTYPQYKENPLFIYGESYGGHYAPATAHRVWKGNQAGTGIHVPLAGLSVGNGMTDPVVQFQWYSKLSYQWCKQVKGQPCVSESQYEQMRQALPECVALAQACNAGASSADCGFAMEVCSGSQMTPFQETGLNVYDIRIPCEGQLCYNFDQATAFMNRQDVQQSLGVASRGITWQTCSMTVNQMFGNDWMRDFNGTIPDLLHSGIRVLIYAGDVDFICNWLGNKAWTLGLQWSGASAYQSALDLPWWVAEQPAGRFRSVAGNGQNLLFTFLQIHDAGHMVPMNQPERALSMVQHFLADQPFYGFAGPLPSNGPSPAPGPGPVPTVAPSAPATTSPAAPSAQQFTQKVCTSSTCTDGCRQDTFNTGTCIPMQDDMSAIATCGSQYLDLQIFYSTDCSGEGTTQRQQLNTCLEDAENTYIENTCSAARP